MRATVNKIIRVQYSIINCRNNIVQQISRIYLTCIIQTLYLLNSNSSFPPQPRPLATTILLSASMNLTI